MSEGGSALSSSASRPDGPVKYGAVGVLVKGSKYLVIKRAEGLIKGGFWCFPGGHVESGEDSADAVKRELCEELGIEVKPVALLGSISVSDTNHLLDIWRVDHVSGEFELNEAEIAEMRWLSPAELRSITPSLFTNSEVLNMLGQSKP